MLGIHRRCERGRGAPMPYFIIWGHRPIPGQGRTIIAERSGYPTLEAATQAGQAGYGDLGWDVVWARSAQDAVVRGATGQLTLTEDHTSPPTPSPAALPSPGRATSPVGVAVPTEPRRRLSGFGLGL